jgi:hypothetical protein
MATLKNTIEDIKDNPKSAIPLGLKLACIVYFIYGLFMVPVPTPTIMLKIFSGLIWGLKPILFLFKTVIPVALLSYLIQLFCQAYMIIGLLLITITIFTLQLC